MRLVGRSGKPGYLKGMVAIVRAPRRRRDMGLWGWLRVLWRAGWRILPDQLGLIAAGIAFYVLLATFPAIAALVALAGLFADPDLVVEQLQSVSRLLPEQAATMLLDQAKAVAGATDEGLSLTFFIGIGFAIYLSTRATSGLLHGLNVAWNVRETRSILRFWAVNILLTAGLLFNGVVLLLLLVGLPAALALIPLDFATEKLVRASRWFIVALVLFFGLAVLYRWGPSREKIRWRVFSAGALVAGLLWFLGSYGFGLYVANFGNYNETFGSLGGVIVLLTWIWLSAFIVLLGALLDAEIDYELGEGEVTDGQSPEEPHAQEHSGSGPPSS